MRDGGRLALAARVLEPPATADELVPILGPGSKPLDRPHHLLLRGFGGDRRGGRESLTLGDRRGADAVARGRRTPPSSAVAAATSTFVVLVSPTTTERSSLSTADTFGHPLRRHGSTIPPEMTRRRGVSRTTPLDDRRPSTSFDDGHFKQDKKPAAVGGGGGVEELLSKLSSSFAGPR